VGEGNMIMIEKVKKIIVIASMISLGLIGSLAGGITSYAKGPGEVSTTTMDQASTVTYYQATVRGLGNWVEENNQWKFKLNTGGYLTNSWIESLSEAGAFYYVNESGIMLTNTTTPDGYTVGDSGVRRVIVVSNSNGNTSSTSSDSEKRDSNGLTDADWKKIMDQYFLGVGSHDGQAWN
jgi:hypothetical protein